MELLEFDKMWQLREESSHLELNTARPWPWTTHPPELWENKRLLNVYVTWSMYFVTEAWAKSATNPLSLLQMRGQSSSAFLHNQLRLKSRILEIGRYKEIGDE